MTSFPIHLLFGYRPPEKLRKKAEYHPAMPFELKRKLKETDPAVFLDYFWLFVFFVSLVFAAVILLLIAIRAPF